MTPAEDELARRHAEQTTVSPEQAARLLADLADPDAMDRPT